MTGSTVEAWSSLSASTGGTAPSYTAAHTAPHRSAPLHDDSTMLQQRHTGTGNGINHWQTQWKPQRRCYHRLPLSTTPVTVTHPILSNRQSATIPPV